MDGITIACLALCIASLALAVVLSLQEKHRRAFVASLIMAAIGIIAVARMENNLQERQKGPAPTEQKEEAGSTTGGGGFF